MNNMDPLYQLMVVSRQARELEKEIHQIHLLNEANASRAWQSRSFRREWASSRKLFSKIRLVLLHAFLQKDFNLNNK
jgi:hypothetical protein